ncbi:unnamed protein product [Phaedon cochleariae]|uniref:Gag-like protein n=1 Tax=Phaedon cochleariae TaxID=80249 RepID=A0A9N9SDI2_PHACE|nr:unnamed protein product [Phaedon cochleariae]
MATRSTSSTPHPQTPPSPNLSNDDSIESDISYSDRTMLQKITKTLNFSSALKANNNTSNPNPPPTSSSNNTNTNTQQTFNLRSLPTRSQKQLHNPMNTHEILRNQILFLKANLNQTALLKINSNITQSQLETKLKNATGENSIRVILLNPRILPNKKPPTTRNPTFSMVIKGVPKDITMEDLEESFKEISFPTIEFWRITSRATNQPTTLIRVITDSESCYSRALNLGISFFGMKFQVEPSNPNPIPPIPKYCSRCAENGHSLEECKNRISCPHCGEEHKPQQCPKIQNPKCKNCNGDHPAFSPKCPKRAEPPQTPSEVAPVVLTPLPILPELTEATKTIIMLNTIVLINTLPERRQLILTSLNKNMQVLFGHTCICTCSGGQVKFFFNKI